jgi:hypothetical protein
MNTSPICAVGLLDCTYIRGSTDNGGIQTRGYTDTGAIYRLGVIRTLSLGLHRPEVIRTLGLCRVGAKRKLFGHRDLWLCGNGPVLYEPVADPEISKGGGVLQKGGPTPDIAKNSRILGLKSRVFLIFDGKGGGL